MARRADFVDALRDFAERMAALAPSPRVEERVRAMLRGEAVPERPSVPLMARMRRPALALLFAVVATIAVIEGSSAPDFAPPIPSSANSQNEPDNSAPIVD